MSARSSLSPQRQRREQQRAAAARREHEKLERQRRTRRLRTLAVLGGAVVVVVVVVVGIALTSVTSVPHRGATSTSTTPGPVGTEPFQPGSQATLAATAPPWPLPSDARPFIAAAGLKVLGQQALAVHYHAHLDIIVSGSTVQVPAGVGFVIANGREAGTTVLHTHDTSGIVHIESPTNSPYALGQFFTEWGVRLGPGQLGGLTDSNGHTLRVYVDGRAFSGDPASIVLRPHQEVALWYGPATTTPQVPSGYQFPAGA